MHKPTAKLRNLQIIHITSRLSAENPPDVICRPRTDLYKGVLRAPLGVYAVESIGRAMSMYKHVYVGHGPTYVEHPLNVYS